MQPGNIFNIFNMLKTYYFKLIIAHIYGGDPLFQLGIGRPLAPSRTMSELLRVGRTRFETALVRATCPLSQYNGTFHIRCEAGFWIHAWSPPGVQEQHTWQRSSTVNLITTLLGLCRWRCLSALSVGTPRCPAIVVEAEIIDYSRPIVCDQVIHCTDKSNGNHTCSDTERRFRSIEQPQCPNVRTI